MPERYGPRDRVYDLFRRWQRNGTWKRILEQLQAEADAKDLITWDVSVDSTIAGDLQKEPPGGVDVEPDDHGLGRSRGGLTTKLHLAVEQGQKPLSLLVTVGQRHDSPQFTGPGRHPHAPNRAGPTTLPAGQGSCRPGLRLAREPRLPAQASTSGYDQHRPDSS